VSVDVCVNFLTGQVAYHLWDQDPVLLLHACDPEEAHDRGYLGKSIDDGLYVCWHVLGLVSGKDWFVLDCDLEHEV
jgi:hypothetical protein